MIFTSHFNQKPECTVLSHLTPMLYTVNSEISARVLFSRNFAYAKFHENKILAKWQNHFCCLLIKVKSCSSCKFLTSQICLLKLFAKIKFSAKISEFTVYIRLILDWLQSLKQFFINVSYHILVASLTLMALF